jgi:hypothetical protein
VARVLYHVTSSLNRASIADHGLDWRRAPAARGFDGGASHEHPGVFLARDCDETDWLVAMGKSRAARGLRRNQGLDVWEVSVEDDLDEVEGLELPCLSVDDFLCWSEPIPAARLRLIKQDL